MQELRTIKYFSLFLLSIFFMFGCYYDNKQELYPDGPPKCDTASISYSKHIAPIMAQSCNVCHNQNNASGTWKTETHANLVATVNGNRIIGCLEWKSGFINMPLGGMQLSTCSIDKIKAWINAKMPNN